MIDGYSFTEAKKRGTFFLSHSLIPSSSRTREEGSREKTFTNVIFYPQGEPYHRNTTPSKDETGIDYGDPDELVSVCSNPIILRGEVHK